MLCLILAISSVSSKRTEAEYFYNSARPLIIAHRGASGYIPEHTLQAYEVAAYMGADFVEPDLCPSKDGYLVINHENMLNDTTNVAFLPQLEYLLTTKTVPTNTGFENETGWFIEDFTLNQIKQLKSKQRLSFRPNTLDYYFEKIIIDEALDWAIKKNQQRAANNQPLVGVYIELKKPAYFNSLGFPVEDMLLKVLRKRGIDNIQGASKFCPIILQCFELESLVYMSQYTDLPLIYLVESSNVQYSFSYLADVVNGVGPSSSFIFTPQDQLTDYVSQAHANDLAVHMWVVRDDVPIGNFTRQQFYAVIRESGLDGIFDEFPDSATIFFNLN